MKTIRLFLLLLCTNQLYTQIPNELSNQDKVYGLSKFWQEVNYNYVYLDRVDRAEWDKQYQNLITEVQNTENDYEYYRLLQKFCATLKDGHTNIFMPKNIQDNILTNDFGDFKIFLSNIDGKAIITQINQNKRKELPIGTEILKVNGITTLQYINQYIKPYISSSTDHVLNNRSVEYMLRGYKGSTIDLEVKLPNNNIKQLKLTRSKCEDTELYPVKNSDLFEFKWIKEDIAYMALNSFASWDIMSSFSDKFSELHKAKKLIIDIRKNGGGYGNVGREIIKFLTKDTILYGTKYQSRLHVPTYKAWGKWTKEKDTVNSSWNTQSYLSYRDKYVYDFPYRPYSTSNMEISRLEIPTVILIGNHTASAAEDFLVYAYNQEHMIKMGEKTFGSTGQPMYFDLINGSQARICTRKDMYPDGQEFIGYGIKPDIEVKTTLSDFIENKDPVLEKAITYLNKNY